MRDQAAQPDRVDVDAVDVGAAGAVQRRPSWRPGIGPSRPRAGLGDQLGGARAVPLGASTLFGWCSSMISTDSK